MKIADINKIFTEKVAEYIARGYIINTRTMSGHQGEICKVDLVRDNTLIRVWLNSESSHNWLDDNAFHGNLVVLRVSMWNQPATKSSETVWMSELEHLEEISFYQIATYADWYLDNYDEALAAQKTRSSRYVSCQRNQRHDITNPETQKIAASYLKNCKKYKRVSKEAIIVYKYPNTNSYSISYHGKNYKLS